MWCARVCVILCVFLSVCVCVYACLNECLSAYVRTRAYMCLCVITYAMQQYGFILFTVTQVAYLEKYFVKEFYVLLKYFEKNLQNNDIKIFLK